MAKARTYYFVEDDYMGQHGTFIDEVMLTLAEFRQARETGIVKGKRGFITKSYESALYYTQD